VAGIRRAHALDHCPGPGPGNAAGLPRSAGRRHRRGRGPGRGSRAEAAAPAGPAACALAYQYRYEFHGPELALSYDDSTLSPAREFLRRRQLAIEPGQPTQSCTTLLPACGSPGIDVGDVAAALADPDVESAFAAANDTFDFGAEPPLGGGWSILRSDGRRLHVGGAGCADSRGCDTRMPGMNRLRALLLALDAQELKKPGCLGFGQ
jgi:hypothetical protein